MLLVALCAILCGAYSWVAIELWGQAKLEWLRRYVPLLGQVRTADKSNEITAIPELFDALLLKGAIATPAHCKRGALAVAHRKAACTGSWTWRLARTTAVPVDIAPPVFAFLPSQLQTRPIGR